MYLPGLEQHRQDLAILAHLPPSTILSARHALQQPMG
jgi:hypothetical protein